MDPYLALSVQKHIAEQGVRDVLPRYLGEEGDTARSASSGHASIGAGGRATACRPTGGTRRASRATGLGGPPCAPGPEGVWVDKRLWAQTREQAREKAVLERRVEQLTSQLDLVDGLQRKCRDLEASVRELAAKEHGVHANLSRHERAFHEALAEHDGAASAARGVDAQRLALRAREAEGRAAEAAGSAGALREEVRQLRDLAGEQAAALADLRRAAAAREAETREYRKAAKAAGTLLQHVNQLEHDNARLVALLRSTAEYREFADVLRFGRGSYLLPPESPSFADLHVLSHRDPLPGDRPPAGGEAECAAWVPEEAVAAVEAFRWRHAREAPSAAVARMVSAVAAAYRAAFRAAADREGGPPAVPDAAAGGGGSEAEAADGDEHP